MHINRRQFSSLLAALTLLPAQQAFADRRRRRRGRRRGRDDDDDEHEHDHEYADRARRSDNILPLRDVLAHIKRSIKGEIVGVEFEREYGRWVYEIKMIAVDGRYYEIYVDAMTGRTLKIEGE